MTTNSSRSEKDPNDGGTGAARAAASPSAATVSTSTTTAAYVSLYSEECMIYLKRALEHAEQQLSTSSTQQDSSAPRIVYPRGWKMDEEEDSSSEEEDGDDKNRKASGEEGGDDGDGDGNSDSDDGESSSSDEEEDTIDNGDGDGSDDHAGVDEEDLKAAEESLGLTSIAENEEENDTKEEVDIGQQPSPAEQGQSQVVKSTKKKKQSKSSASATTTASKLLDKKQIQRHVDSLACVSWPIQPTSVDGTAVNGKEDTSGSTTATTLDIPMVLFSKEKQERLQSLSLSEGTDLLTKRQHQEEEVQFVASMIASVSSIQSCQKPIVAMHLQSGKFAAAVFAAATAAASSGGGHFRCIHHTTKSRYTIRKGQGKAQSTQDGSRRPKSIGSQLRRYGEQQLQEDIRNTCTAWKRYLETAAYVLVACPKTLHKYLHDAMAPVLDFKRDPRIRRVPVDIGQKPTYETVTSIHTIMTTFSLKQQHLNNNNSSSAVGNDSPPTTTQTASTAATTASPTPIIPKKDKHGDEIIFEMTPIHVAAATGDVDTLLQLLDDAENIASIEGTTPDESNNETNDENGTKPNVSPVDMVAGQWFMTPLHYAAASTTANDGTTALDGAGAEVDETTTQAVDETVAAECVYQLLVRGRADPRKVDARNRVPYFLAAHDKVREAFRRARAELGESYCDWDSHAKVGPALSIDDIQAKKEKEAEKKRRKKQRAKERKAQEKAQAERLQQQKEAEEAKRQAEVEAKRIRDGLQPKPSGATAGGKDGIVCDYCQKVCVGKRGRKPEMFYRLQYAYCSSDCVNRHKRELMANAALARFG